VPVLGEVYGRQRCLHVGKVVVLALVDHVAERTNLRKFA